MVQRRSSSRDFLEGGVDGRTREAAQLAADSLSSRLPDPPTAIKHLPPVAAPIATASARCQVLDRIETRDSPAALPRNGLLINLLPIFLKTSSPITAAFTRPFFDDWRLILRSKGDACSRVEDWCPCPE